MNLRGRGIRWLGLLLAAALIVAGRAAAQTLSSFTPGDLVVYRAGDGTTALANTGNPVFLDEYSPTGTLVGSLEMPTIANGAQNAFFASGSATSEGALTVSPNGQWIAVTGYASTVSASNPIPNNKLTSSTVPRVVGIINTSTGAIDTSTAPSDFALGNNPRSAVTTDGKSIWIAGAAGGVRYTAVGNTGTSTMVSPTEGTSNIRQVNIFGGQLYVTSSSGGATFDALGTGLPTTANQTLTPIPGFPQGDSDIVHENPFSYFFAELNPSDGQAEDTLYVTDDTTHTGANGGTPGPAGGITKYSLVNGNWVATGSIDETSSNYRGLTGVVENGNVVLYATRGAANDAGDGLQIVTLTDTSGFGGTLTATPTVFATAAANEAFRGIGALSVTGLPGDMNLDGHVNNADMVTLMQALANPTQYEAAHDLSASQLLTLGDINHDGVFNNADLQAFLLNMQNGGGNLSTVPEPSALTLCGLSLAGLCFVVRRKRNES
jgi:hypothetical protein